MFDPTTGQERPFTFDYSFWSHDGFKNDSKGVAIKVSEQYADQDFVYDALGKQVLDNAWEGYNCCLFAYGQTGAGKSYSMVSTIINMTGNLNRLVMGLTLELSLFLAMKFFKG